MNNNGAAAAAAANNNTHIYNLLRDYNQNINIYNNNINLALRYLIANGGGAATATATPTAPRMRPPTTTAIPNNHRVLDNLLTRLLESLNGGGATDPNTPINENDLTISFSFLRETDEIPIYEFTAQPIPPHVTETIYNNCTQLIDYDITNQQLERICPISHEPFEDGEIITQIRGCQHIFKTQNIKRWFLERSSCCPTCRYDIISQTHHNAAAAVATNHRPV